MAAAEARAAWQRANRYFVQEDAKRAPKLASCQPTSSKVDSGPVNTADRTDPLALGFMPFNRTLSYSNLPPDAKWGLQVLPNFVHRRSLNIEHFSLKNTDVNASPLATIESHSQVEIAALGEESLHNVKFEDLESSFDAKKNSELKMEELNVGDSKVDHDFLDVKNMTDYYELLEMETVGGSVLKQSNKFSPDADDSWAGGDKVPWWRVTDGEELASFVAQKSLYHVANCDLPPPQKMHVMRESCTQSKRMDHDAIFMSPVERAQNGAIPSLSSAGSRSQIWSSIKRKVSETEYVATGPLRASSNDPLEKGGVSVNDLDKAKLLEALCYSQTRANEAEMAAKQAYTEKEHALKLIFRQASQLFAYKQWLKLLQLENLLLQTENDGSSPVTANPDLLPWMPPKPQKLRKSWQKRRRRRGSDDNDIGKYAVAFAVGFTLVGAGVILGWTVGWLLPAF